MANFISEIIGQLIVEVVFGVFRPAPTAKIARLRWRAFLSLLGAIGSLVGAALVASPYVFTVLGGVLVLGFFVYGLRCVHEHDRRKPKRRDLSRERSDFRNDSF